MRAKGFSYLLCNSSSLKKVTSFTTNFAGRWGKEDNFFNIDKKKTFVCVRIMFSAFKMTTTEREWDEID